MGKQAKLRKARRALRTAVHCGNLTVEEANEAYREAKGRSPADDFHVGATFKGPPEAFGLPPGTRILDESANVTVSAIDQERGTITLTTSAGDH